MEQNQYLELDYEEIRVLKRTSKILVVQSSVVSDRLISELKNCFVYLIYIVYYVMHAS